MCSYISEQNPSSIETSLMQDPAHSSSVLFRNIQHYIAHSVNFPSLIDCLQVSKMSLEEKFTVWLTIGNVKQISAVTILPRVS